MLIIKATALVDFIVDEPSISRVYIFLEISDQLSQQVLKKGKQLGD
jgi:hypothetical protein